MKKLIACSIALLTWTLSPAQEIALAVKADEVKGKVSPRLWGVFFEDINFGADGGIYAELIKNRSFEFLEPLMGWKKLGQNLPEGSLLVLNRSSEKPSNPRFLRINKASADVMGLQNEGFRGMGIKKGLAYDFSVMYRQMKPGISLRVELVDTTGKVLGKGLLATEAGGKDWTKQQIRFTANEGCEQAQFRIWFEGEGEIDLDMISLFPTDTWKQRPGGFRADMVQLLADMKPSFVRFPGGCIVEGRDLANRYQWKKTVGPLEDRQLIINRWNTEFSHRPAPDYFQTFGLGFFEYFQLAEDVGAEALPILNCGMACQFNTGELVPLDELDPYIQDALDLIEFANGAVSTNWGRLRADMGHPEPFNLKLLGVGNENWGPQYVERFALFQEKLKARHPEIELIASAGPFSDGDLFEFLDKEFRELKADIIDEHYYRSPEWFLENATRYDDYDRNGPKIFAGEYAAHARTGDDGKRPNSWRAAIAEAAFLTGIERNADVVEMASYAPLFAHAEGWQWTPDLIWVDNLQAYGTPNYYVQKLYATNTGSEIVSITANGKVPTGESGIYASALRDDDHNLIIKIVNTGETEKFIPLSIESRGTFSEKASHWVLKAADLDEVNSFADPEAVAPQEQSMSFKRGKGQLKLAANSFHVLKFKAR